MSDRKKSSLELADVVRQFGEPYIEKYQDVILPSQRKALRDIAACQTKALGGQRFQCNDCGKDFWQYHGCRNRSCPKCHGSQIEQWLEKREAEVLPCGYFHSVITVPEELRPIFLKHQKVMYGYSGPMRFATRKQDQISPRKQAITRLEWRLPNERNSQEWHNSPTARNGSTIDL